jgi:8-oxo-dGTP pyrophosphatase MutT (NUDIX family)
LTLYARLPTWARRRVVRTVAPSFTVGAICLIERSDGAILLVRQVYRHHWGIPGGLLQRGEEPADAVRREVVEEVGLPVDLAGEPAVVVDAEAQRVDVVFRARPADGVDPAVAKPESPEIAEVRWFARTDLPDLQYETTQAFVALARADVGRVGPPPGFDDPTELP